MKYKLHSIAVSFKEVKMEINKCFYEVHANDSLLLPILLLLLLIQSTAGILSGSLSKAYIRLLVDQVFPYAE